MRSIKLLPTVILLFLILGCASTSIPLNKPHYYSNNYNEVVDAVDRALKQNDMAVVESDEQPGNYYIKIYSVRVSQDDAFDPDNASFNRDMLHTADIWIKKIDNSNTEIKVQEEEQSGMSSSEQKRHLAHDFYRKLNKMLTLKEES